MKIEEYAKLERTVEELQRSSERAKGSLDSLMDKLKDEFNCSSTEEAGKKLSQLKKKQARLKDELEESMETFKEKWKDVLSEQYQKVLF